MINFTGLNIAKSVDKFENTKFAAIAGNIEKQNQKILAQLSSDIFERTSKDAIFSQKTFKKARDFVMQSILADKPMESVAVVLDDKIVFTKIGYEHNCPISEPEMRSLFKKPHNKVAIIHSHPKNKTGDTYPVSIGDYEFICSPERPAIRSIYAINTNGEYSVLKKTDDKRIKEGYRVIPGEFQDAISKYLMLSNDIMCIKYRELESKLSSSYDLKPEDFPIINAQKDIVEAIQTPEFLNAFWQELAGKLGVKYETNFSGFC